MRGPAPTRAGPSEARATGDPCSTITAMDTRPMGVFDSGVGGLTVLHECLVTMPHEDFVYLGDHARLPYGPRPIDEVREFSREIGAFLERQDGKLIVCGGNAGTAAARRRHTRPCRRRATAASACSRRSSQSTRAATHGSCMTSTPASSSFP